MRPGLTRPELFLRSVNRFFYENTSASAFGSFFFAQYDDDSQRRRYAHSGHPSGLVLRPDNRCMRLGSTGTLLGLFHDRECNIAECDLAPGDGLVLYTDGITEAPICARSDHRRSPQTRWRRSHDDITLILGRCRKA